MVRSKIKKSKYNWESLRQEFFNSDFLEITSFIRQRLGKETVSDNHIARKVAGWTDEKKAWTRKRLEKVQKEADKALMEKLKIHLKDLLINKKLLFSLDGKYLECLAKLAKGEKL